MTVMVNGRATVPDGVTHPLKATYISGSGTAGVDNTLQDVKTVIIPARSLNQIGDRLRIRTYFKGDSGSAITATTKLNTVEVASSTDIGSADWFMTEAWLHYIDNTHANIAETGTVPATGGNSAENVAGFDWAAAQNCVVSQNAASGNHIIVFCIFLDIYPKGVN